MRFRGGGVSSFSVSWGGELYSRTKGPHLPPDEALDRHDVAQAHVELLERVRVPDDNVDADGGGDLVPAVRVLDLAGLTVGL